MSIIQGSDFLTPDVIGLITNKTTCYASVFPKSFGFVCSSLIYDEDRIPFVVRGLMQLVICACVLLVGYFISGGIPDGAGFGVGAIYFLVEMVFGIILWLGGLYFVF